jgi:hypothetical protein
MRARLRQFQPSGEADAAAAARDPCHFAFQAHAASCEIPNMRDDLDFNDASYPAGLRCCADEKLSARIIDCARMKSTSARNRRSWIKATPNRFCFYS